jgi:hypothetical protein
MKTITKTINIGTQFLLSGVEDFFSDLIEEGYTITEALDIISSDAVLRFELGKSYSSYMMSGSSTDGDGVYEVELEKIK